jgi:hypothetical protein
LLTFPYLPRAQELRRSTSTDLPAPSLNEGSVNVDATLAKKL